MNDWINGEEHAERARAFLQSGQLDKALSELKLALAINPHHGEWHFGVGLTLEAMKRHDEALAAFQRVVELRGPDALALTHMGANLIRLGRYEAALTALSRASRIEPDFEAACCYRIQAAARLGDHDRAEAEFYLARQLQDECPHCFDYLAHSLLARGQVDRAIWCWQQTLRLAPEHRDVRTHLGLAHWRSGKVDRAGVYFEQQLNMSPDDLFARLSLGRLQVAVGKFVEASRTFRSVIEREPAHAEAHFLMGELAVDCEQFEEAAAEYEIASRLDPRLLYVHLRLAQIELLRGRVDRVRSLLMMEVDKPDHCVAEAVEMGRLLIEVNLMDEAIALLTRVITETDLAEEAALARQENPAKSLTRVLPATIDPHELAEALICRGFAFLAAGHRDSGVADWRRAVHLAPANAMTLNNLATAYLSQGRLLRAMAFHRRARGLSARDPMVRRLGRRILRARIAHALRDGLRVLTFLSWLRRR